MFIKRVPGVRPGRVCGGRQHVIELTDDNDVRRVTTTRTFRVVRVDSPTTESGNCALDEATLIEGISMDIDLGAISK